MSNQWREEIRRHCRELTGDNRWNRINLVELTEEYSFENDEEIIKSIEETEAS